MFGVEAEGWTGVVAECTKRGDSGVPVLVEVLVLLLVRRQLQKYKIKYSEYRHVVFLVFNH